MELNVSVRLGEDPDWKGFVVAAALDNLAEKIRAEGLPQETFVLRGPDGEAIGSAGVSGTIDEHEALDARREQG